MARDRLVDLSRISVVAELVRLGWPHRPSSKDELACRCPMHDDEHFSCSVSTSKRVFKCHVANCPGFRGGDLVTFLAAAVGVDRATAFVDLDRRYKLTTDSSSPVSQTTVEKWHRDIWSAPHMLDELHRRCVTEKLIRKYRLGYHGGRVTIPITNDDGSVVNVRRYLPGAPGCEKMLNMRGRGKLRIWPREQLRWEKIILCGGEIKAIVAADRMNSLKIGAVTVTGGEGAWSADLASDLSDKTVYVCFDVDDAGKVAAKRLSRILTTTTVRAVHVVSLPLDPADHPSGDVNDYFAGDGTAKQLLELIEGSAAVHAGVSLDTLSSTKPTRVSLRDAVKPDTVGLRTKTAAVVSAVDTTPYVVPERVRCSCDRRQPLCHECPIFAMKPNDDGFVELEVHPESAAVLEIAECSKKTQRDVIRRSLKIPRCKSVEFRTSSYRSYLDCRLSPQIELHGYESDGAVTRAFCLGHRIDGNETYEFTGRMYPHPATQQAILVMGEVLPVKDTLTTYSPSSEDLSKIEVFRPSKWTIDCLREKLDHVYSDIEHNVTRIFRRRRMHLVIDLAYHSVLSLKLGDGGPTRGWVEVLIAGDSSQGKTEATTKMMLHYGLGEKWECKNATVAGLLGGLQQMNGRWYVTWGIIPRHDRRLVILEELKGTSVEVLSKLTDMRSSGIAELPKIERRKTYARTRIVAVSNPRSNRTMSCFNYGIDAVLELMGSPEDVRRFDVVCLLSRDRVRVEDIDADRLAECPPHVYSSDVCHSCVLWAWTRSCDQIIMEEGVERAIVAASHDMCNKYTEAIPVVDRGSMSYKLARLATALACRTFSTNDGERVIVRCCHVEYVVSELDSMYSSDELGYAAMTTSARKTSELRDADRVRERILGTPFPSDLVERLLDSNDVDVRDLCDWCGFTRDDAASLVSFLVRKRAMRRSGFAYAKSSEFISLLKSVTASELSSQTDPEEKF